MVRTCLFASDLYQHMDYPTSSHVLETSPDTRRRNGGALLGAYFDGHSHPPSTPLLPQGINQLTMFAVYRVPQILHHLRILDYPPTLLHPQDPDRAPTRLQGRN